MHTHCLRARWMFPVDQPPIEDGVIRITNGRITSLNSGPDADADDLGDAAIIPGLVNAHTHLEFSDLSEPVTPACPFPSWLRSVVHARRQRSGSHERMIARGLRECAASGTTLVGDIATGETSVSRFDSSSPAGVVFREVIGIAEAATEEQMAVARRHLAQADRDSPAHVIRGLSPHAPYSVSAELFQRCVHLAAEANAPAAMHLAETQEELELLRKGTGPLVDFLKEIGVWRDRFWMSGGEIQNYLDVLARAPRALVIHGNYLTPPEIDFLARQPQMTVVYCPRTHRYFGHRQHPWRTLLSRGASVAFGTDSRASNPDLSLWGELQHLWRTFADVSADSLLELATYRGAVALGRGDATGTLSPGKSADLAVVRICAEAQNASSKPSAKSLLHPGNDIAATMREGRWIHR